MPENFLKFKDFKAVLHNQETYNYQILRNTRGEIFYYTRKSKNKIELKLISFHFQMLYIPIVIYVPALAFAQVTGISLSVLIPLCCAVCIFYTCLVSIFSSESKPICNDQTLLIKGRSESCCVDGYFTNDVNPVGRVDSFHNGDNKCRRDCSCLGKECRRRSNRFFQVKL